MFPVLGFVMIDPVPNLIVHPSAQFQIGFNSMYSITTGQNYRYDKDTYDTTTTSHSDYYYGLIMKAIVDANYNLGESSTIFLGVEYQWAGTKTQSNTAGLFAKRDMSGIGLRAGWRFKGPRPPVGASESGFCILSQVRKKLDSNFLSSP